MRSQLLTMGESQIEGGMLASNVRPQSGILWAARWAKIEFFFAAIAVFLSPMNFLRHPTVYFTLGDVFAVLCFFTLVASRSLPLRPLGAITSIWMTAAIVLISGLLLSSLLFGDPVRGIVTSLQYFFCLFVLPLIISWRPLPQVITLIKIFLISIIITCLFGIYLIDVDGETNTRFVSGSGRMMSFVERENECASLIALTVPLVLWLRNTRNISLPYFWFALLVLSYGILLTGSNTGVFALMFALLIQLAAHFSWKQVTVASASAALIVLALSNQGANYLPITFQKRVLGALTSGDLDQAGTFVGRVNLIKESFGVIEHNGLLGIGADQYQLISYWSQPVHNFYLLIWAEGGFVGFVGYLLILLSGFFAGVVAIRDSRNTVGAVCTFTTILTFALITNAVPHIYGRFWFVPLLLSISVSVSTVYTSRAGYPDKLLARSALSLK
jgi:O-antigen ligase